MAYDKKPLAKTVGSEPVPQYYGETADQYEAIKGANGAIRTMVYDASGNPLLTSTNPGSVQLAGSNMIKGTVQNVTTAGSRLQLPNYPCREITVIAKRGNTGSIYVGGNDVSASVYGVELQARDSFTLAVSNTNLIYIDSSVNGEGISYVAI